MVCDDDNNVKDVLESYKLFMDWMVANLLLGERSQERHRR